MIKREGEGWRSKERGESKESLYCIERSREEKNNRKMKNAEEEQRE